MLADGFFSQLFPFLNSNSYPPGYPSESADESCESSMGFDVIAVEKVNQAPTFNKLIAMNTNDQHCML